ncbi:MAG: alpha/beta hydrolase [Verrucomicrobia bacterium]|nr:alpha/beta hydrolase [Verrucomicrobiota bacterium]
MKRAILFIALVGSLVTSTLAQSPTLVGYKRTEDVIYSRKFGTALTLDVFEPEKKNGAAVFFMVSGGFVSSHDGVSPRMYHAFLERGYTVFAVVHACQPKFQIPEIQNDIHRAIRYVRHNASRWGIDTNKFGITGGSAGGHLSLTMGTQGKPGSPTAKDLADRASSAVQAVACFFPPTDFENWSAPGDNQVGIGKVGTQFKGAFGPKSDSPEGRAELGKEISPLNFVTAASAPALIIHGDADKLVPIYQAQIYEKKCKEAGAVCKIITRPGADHGWKDMEKDLTIFADWFDEHLRGIKPKE